MVTLERLFTTLAAEGSPTGAGGAGGEGGIYFLLMWLVPMGLFFYFFMIRPESKRRKEREQLLNAVKAKDKVVTIGGIHGTVVAVEKDAIVVQVDPKKDVKLRVRRTSIDSIVAEGDDEKK